MSFSSEVKAELAKNISNARHCRIAELSGMMSMVADVWYRNGKIVQIVHHDRTQYHCRDHGNFNETPFWNSYGMLGETNRQRQQNLSYGSR